MDEINSSDPYSLCYNLIRGNGDSWEEQYSKSIVEEHLSNGAIETKGLEFGQKPTSESTYMKKLTERLKQQKLVRSVEAEIPPQIFGDYAYATIVDYKVENKTGPDDLMYTSHQVLRQHIPRGFSILNLRSKENTSCMSDVVIYANKKFTGSPFDEDNEAPIQQDWKEFFIKPCEETHQVLCMNKENGEAAHISGRFINSIFYFIAGSKNVHIIFNCREHIEFYTETRFSIAKEIAHYVLDYFTKCDERKQRMLQSLLHYSKCTINGEILRTTSQHIVPIDTNRLVVFCFTPQPVTEEIETTTSLTFVNPVHSLQLLEYLGFNTPLYEIIDYCKINERNKEIRRKIGTEGEVHYYLDSENRTIGMTKLKTLWYIFIRAIRQQTLGSYFSKRRSPNIQNAIQRFENRMKDFESWLSLSQEDFQEWKDIGVEWLTWVLPKIHEYSRVSFFDQFPSIWNQFENECNISYRAMEML